MAVLIEAISVVIRRTSISDRYPGGWQSFKARAPNKTLCSDEEVVRIGFMTPDDCQSFVESLQRLGFTFATHALTDDLVVADQMRGFTVPCEWADFGSIELAHGKKVSTAQLKGTCIKQIFCPEDWQYEGSLSEGFGFVPSDSEAKSLRFLRHADGLDVYLNLLTGMEVYVGRRPREG